VGERVEVILDRIDRQQMRLQFALLPGTEPVASSSPRKAPGEEKRVKAKAKTKSKKRR
jgi:ribonuclease R